MGFIWKLLPSGWKFSVLIKRLSLLAGKGAAALVVYANTQAPGFLENLGVNVNSEAFSVGVAVLVAGLLETIHDNLKMRYPESKWL